MKRKKIPKWMDSHVRFESKSEDNQKMKELFEDLKIVNIQNSKEVSIPVQRKNQSSSKNAGFSRPDDILDLHGKTREEAIMMLQNFITTSFQKKLRSLLIITGKGLHSGGNGPILNNAVRLWLRKNGKGYIREYHTAPPKFGGEGAVWVDLL